MPPHGNQPPTPSARVQIDSVILVVVMIIIQFLALVWYTLSYIPYARDLVWGCVTKCGR